MGFAGAARSGRSAAAASALPRRYRRDDFAGRKFEAGHRPGQPAGEGAAGRGWGPPQNRRPPASPTRHSREFLPGFQKIRGPAPAQESLCRGADFAAEGRQQFDQKGPRAGLGPAGGRPPPCSAAKSAAAPTLPSGGPAGRERGLSGRRPPLGGEIPRRADSLPNPSRKCGFLVPVLEVPRSGRGAAETWSCTPAGEMAKIPKSGATPCRAGGSISPAALDRKSTELKIHPIRCYPPPKKGQPMQRSSISRRFCRQCERSTKHERNVTAMGCGDLILVIATCGLWWVVREIAKPKWRCSECGA
jgi:hypothetical protein